jgi:hypothetical protein
VVNGFPAKFGGRCGLCDGPIREGEDVEYVEDEIVHSDCADDFFDEDE